MFKRIKKKAVGLGRGTVRRLKNAWYFLLHPRQLAEYCAMPLKGGFRMGFNAMEHSFGEGKTWEELKAERRQENERTR